jgi:uncharacterized protein (UPF0254 family)
MIKIATAECFTHGMIGRELHSFSRGYPSIIPSDFFKTPRDISVVCSMFIPTVESLKNVLGVEAPKPFETLDGIKVYREAEDRKVALLMAESVREISDADIGVGTTAGIGRGGIAFSTPRFNLVTSSMISIDLRSASPQEIISREESGTLEALKFLKNILENSSLLKF